MAIELVPHNIQVNAIAPEWIVEATSAAGDASTWLTRSRYFGVVLQAFANTGLAGDVR